MTEEQRPYEVKTIDRRPNFEPDSTLAVAGHSPADMMALAMTKGMDLDKLEKMLELQERWEANEAKKAFFDAVANFKESAPVVKKDKFNAFFKSWYTSLGNLLDTYNPVLGRNGLSISFPTPAQTDSSMTVECRLSHRLGHNESVSMTAPIDKAAIGKASGERSRNAIQDIKSTFTYLRSATAEAILGVTGTEAGQDDDGNGTGTQYINEKQAVDIGKIINEKNVDKVKFLAYMGIDVVEHIPAKEYGKAMGALKVAKGKIKTISCPDKDGGDVDVKICDTCTSRKGCPSW